MGQSRLRKVVSKKISIRKRPAKSSRKNANKKDYVEMLFHTGEKTLDSDSLIKESQKRVSNFIVNGVKYYPFNDNSEKFLRDHVNSRVNIFVMYVDMVDSTNLTLTLPEGKIVKIITSFAQEMAHTVAQFGGYMLKFVGDAVLAYFNAEHGLAYPADNILNCAKSMIRVLNEAINPILYQNDYPMITAKIGIDCGENIIVRYGSDREKSHVDILGASMNMAAKIQNMAKPNQILIGGDVYDRLHPETQKSFNQKTLSSTKWKYHHRKTGKPYPIYVYNLTNLLSKEDIEKISPRISNSAYLRNKILKMAEKNGITEPYYKTILDYSITKLESNGLGEEYYGYHNVEHLLEVPLCTLLVGNSNKIHNLSHEDLKYLFVSAIFHDFEPDKVVDKPNEENVLRNIQIDSTLKELILNTGIDFEIVKALIYRTTYPWVGKLKQDAEKAIERCFEASTITKNNPEKQEHYVWLGWVLSIIDRLASYAFGDFSKAMHVAKMNSHSLAWHPDVLVQRSVTYFEEITKKESKMCEMVLGCLPTGMQKNFTNTVQKFTELRQEELQNKNDFANKNLKFVAKMELQETKKTTEFANRLHSIYLELPRPLRFNETNFVGSLSDSKTILATLRLDNANGDIIGFAKGGPLENYNLRSEINDENYGKRNTVFLEPIAIRIGYWGLGAGHTLRQFFLMQAHTMNFDFLTSFAFRDVIEKRTKNMEKAEFVFKFDPERWDYYRIRL